MVMPVQTDDGVLLLLPRFSQCMKAPAAGLSIIETRSEEGRGGGRWCQKNGGRQEEEEEKEY